jgi:hypothetical protein
MPERLRAAVKAGIFYAKWYPKQWMPAFKVQNAECRIQNAEDGDRRSEVRGQDKKAARVINRYLRYTAHSSKRLARTLFHAMLRYGPKLERQQLLLGRFVDIGAELFAITASCLRVERILQSGDVNGESAEVVKLLDYFCQAARLRIEEKFRAIHENADRASYGLAQEVLSTKH